jgi:asparagine N-glycosylation enzyme membrane subunit Stt3
MGIFATLVALWFPPVLGGLLIIAILGTILRVQRGWREYDARNPMP